MEQCNSCKFKCRSGFKSPCFSGLNQIRLTGDCAFWEPRNMLQKNFDEFLLLLKDLGLEKGE